MHIVKVLISGGLIYLSFTMCFFLVEKFGLIVFNINNDIRGDFIGQQS